MSRTVLAVVAGLGLGAAACGGDFAGGGGDAGAGDASAGCGLALAASPAQATVGQPVVLSAEVSGGSGFIELAFTVSVAGAPVGVESTSVETATFSPLVAGVYRVEVSGSQGGDACDGDVLELNAVTSGALTQSYRLVVTAPSDASWRMADRVVELPGGASYTVGTLSTTEVAATVGVARDGTGAPLASYLRVRPVGGGAEEHGFTAADGGFALRALAAAYDLDVVPVDPAVPPHRFAAVAASALASAATLTLGNPITGVVEDGAGQPVVGATVSVAVAGGAAALATTALDGSFALRIQAGAPAVITVTPAGPAGLAVTRTVAGGLAAGDVLAVGYAALASRSLAAQATLADGVSPAPGARVHLAAEVATAASMTIDGGAALAMTGRLAATLVADGAGALPAVTLPRASTTFVVEPAAAGSAAHVLVVDLVAAAAPSVLALAAPASLSGTASGPGGPLDGALIVARPGGVAAGLGGAGAAATTASDGSYALELAPGVAYELEVDGHAAGRRLIAVTAPAAGQAAVLPIALPPTIAVSGRLTGGTIEGARVALYGASPYPVAEAVASAAGRFVLAVPDPGLAAAVVAPTNLRPGRSSW